MRYARTTFAIAALLLLGALLPAAAGAAPAPRHGPLTVTQAERVLHRAHRAVVRARAAELEARHVLAETRRASIVHGANVGRWVGCARWAGWPWREMRTLTYVIERESNGDPQARNSASSASGLLQFLSGWWAGKWDPMDPYQSLRHGYLAWTQVGWQPWSLTAY